VCRISDANVNFAPSMKLIQVTPVKSLYIANCHNDSFINLYCKNLIIVGYAITNFCENNESGVRWKLEKRNLKC
jgi:hypothetical protein